MSNFLNMSRLRRHRKNSNKCLKIKTCLYRVPPKKRNSKFVGLCSNQQFSFKPCWIEHLFLIIITTRSLNWLRTFYFMSNFLWTVIFGICHYISLSLIVPRNSGNRANPENDSPWLNKDNCWLQQSPEKSTVSTVPGFFLRATRYIHIGPWELDTLYAYYDYKNTNLLYILLENGVSYVL